MEKQLSAKKKRAQPCQKIMEKRKAEKVQNTLIPYTFCEGLLQKTGI